MITLTVNTSGLAQILERLEQLASAGDYQAEIGWLDQTPPEIKRRAFLMEYHMARRPGYEHTWAILRRTRLHIEEHLAEDLHQALAQGLTGQELMGHLATLYKERLINYLLTVTEPPLKESTVRWKKWRKDHGLSSPEYPPEKIWVDTAETLNAIDARVVPVGK